MAFWDTLYTIQQDKHKEMEEWLYRHCKLRGLQNIAFMGYTVSSMLPPNVTHC
jgi:hypothetical protein